MLLGFDLLKEISFDIAYGKIQWIQTEVIERTTLWKNIKNNALY